MSRPPLTPATATVTATATATVTTTIPVLDGRHLWTTWKRTFPSPLAAVWDLVDNALDAADPQRRGTLHLYRSSSSSNSSSRISPTSHSTTGGQPTANKHRCRHAASTASDAYTSSSSRPAHAKPAGGTAASDPASSTSSVVDLTGEDHAGTLEREEEDEDGASRYGLRRWQQQPQPQPPPQWEDLVLMNTSGRPIKAMEDIVMPGSRRQRTTTTTTGRDVAADGRTGVTLATAAATLSDLSFVITKSQGTRVGIGIVARALQQKKGDGGAFFPTLSFSLPGRTTAAGGQRGLRDRTAAAGRRGNEDRPGDLTDTDEIRDAVQDTLDGLCTEHGDHDVRGVIAKYGKVPRGPNDDDHGDDDHDHDGHCYYLAGCQRLAEYVREMVRGERWSGHPHVFCLVVTTNRDNADNHNGSSSFAKIVHDVGTRASVQYLHVDSGHFDFLVDHRPVLFDHWPSRLCGLTVFKDVTAHRRIRMTAGNYRAVYDDNPLHPPPGHREQRVHVYCGFDAARLLLLREAQGGGENGNGGGGCLVLVYSGRSGRLIKTFEDGRIFLGLPHTSDNYCQGLTVLVDDRHGTLPLHPTKQGLDFSDEGEDGEVHSHNLRTVVRAAVKLYYGKHLQDVHGKRSALGDSIVAWAAERRGAGDSSGAAPPRGNKCIKSCILSQFEGVHVGWHHKGGFRFLAKHVSAGPDTLQLWDAPPPTPPEFPIGARIAGPDQSSRSKRKVPSQMLRWSASADVGGEGIVAKRRLEVHASETVDAAPANLGRQDADHRTAVTPTVAADEHRNGVSKLQVGSQKSTQHEGDDGPLPPARDGSDKVVAMDDSSDDEEHDEQNRFKTKLAEAREEVRQLRADLAASQSTHGHEKHDLEEENARLKESVRRLKDKKAEYKKRCKDQQDRIAKLESRLHAGR